MARGRPPRKVTYFEPVPPMPNRRPRAGNAAGVRRRLLARRRSLAAPVPRGPFRPPQHKCQKAEITFSLFFATPSPPPEALVAVDCIAPVHAARANRPAHGRGVSGTAFHAFSFRERDRQFEPLPSTGESI